jgi:hypothetical protein
VVAVALDAAGAEAAGEWISRAEPTYPCLIDQDHVVAELYGMVNVPTAVWIDEAGLVVRGPETAGAGESWRTELDRVTRKLSDEGREALRRERARYLGALRAWVREGRHEVREPVPAPSEHESRAAAEFRLGRFLSSAPHLEEAARLAPESWNYRRQAWALDPREDAADRFWAAVDALPAGAYYPSPRFD